jgi:type VI secretion system protein ImpE
MLDALNLAESTLRAGDPAGALAHLSAAVKARPADPALRVFLAQLLCVLGQWERAHTQLNVVADMDPKTAEMREMAGHAIRCELMRAQVFAGKRTPMVFGHPEPWLALLIESLLQAGQGQDALAQDLAVRAFDAAPTTPGKIGDERFEWIADADSRLGPVLEAFVNGRYYWVPFARLSRIAFEPVTDLRDMVWLPAQLMFDNGGEVIAMVPTRYPGSHASADGAIQLARRTDWQPIGNERYAGSGQRVLVTDLGDHNLLGIRAIEFDSRPAAADDSAADGGD